MQHHSDIKEFSYWRWKENTYRHFSESGRTAPNCIRLRVTSRGYLHRRYLNSSSTRCVMTIRILLCCLFVFNFKYIYIYIYKESICKLQSPFSTSHEFGLDSQHSWKFSKKGDSLYTTKTSKSDLLIYSVWHE